MLHQEKSSLEKEKTEELQNTQEFLLAVYNRLYSCFGPRKWWPAETTEEMIIGAILVQNVSWKSTKTALDNLRECGLLSIKGIHGANVGTLALLIRATRYYNTKARKLKAFAELVASEYEGDVAKLLALPLFELKKKLLSVYGIGEETADSIILYGSKQPIFVVDTYTRRIFSRLGVFPGDIGYSEMQQFFMRNLPEEVSLFNEFHALIDCLGSRVCAKTKPACHKCPLNKQCRKEGVF